MSAWMRHGVRPRIAVSFGALGLLLLLLVGLVAARAARLEGQRSAQFLLTQASSALSQQLDNELAERLGDMISMASWLGMQGPAHTQDAWRKLLDETQQTLPQYSWVGISDPNGIVRAATQRLLEGHSVASRPWFQQGVRAPAVVSVHEAKLLAKVLPAKAGEPLRVVDVAAPVQVDGRTVAVLGGHLDWRWAQERSHALLRTFGPDLALRVWIIGDQGQVLLGDPHLWPAQGWKQLQAAPAGQAALTLQDGARYLAAWHRSRPQGAYPGMGWNVVVLQPEATALAHATWLQGVLIGLCFAGALVFAASSWWLASALTGPLRQAATQARLAAAPRTMLSGGDEVAQLSASIRQLAQDLTAREESLVALNQNMDRTLTQRLEGITQENQQLRDFRRTVSHDLRGPLGQMALLLKHMLMREGEDMLPDTRHKVDLVASECARLSQLTDDLLKLAMADEREIQIDQVDHRKLVEQELLRIASSRSGAAPVVHIGPLPMTPGDASLIRQVWANLLSNACKYSQHAPSPEVDIRGCVAGECAKFTVSDNGVGFDAQAASSLFKAFQRQPGTEGYQGMGVGLSIVQRIVQRHGGRVWAESEPGKGAHFHFSLPLRAAG